MPFCCRRSAALLLLLALAAAASALASSQPAPYRLHIEKERWVSHPEGWTRLHRADPQQRLTAHVFVRQRNLEALERVLYDVSDPRSAQYGQHLSREQVDRLVAPAPESVVAVLAWLQHHGVDTEADVEANGNSDILRVHTDVATMERLLGTTYHVYSHRASGAVATRADAAYSLPEEVHAHVDFVGPTVRFPPARPAQDGRRAARPEFSSVDPARLRELYGVGSAVGTSGTMVQGVSSFLGQYMSQSDLQTFFSSYNKASLGQKPTIVGKNDESDPGTEASLDIQYLMSVGQNISTQFWSTPGQQPGSPGNEPFEQWLFDVGNATNAPLVFSVSYGDNENTVLVPYATRVNSEFQKAGARGISLLFSSGDGGVGGGQPSFCSAFIPTFPAASPYVTAVGGTTSNAPEVAASLSSGGFSNYWPRPSYQDDAVAHYFQVAQNLPASNLYNGSGAAFPDVSAQAENFVIVQGGSAQGVDGTSCSAPTFSGVVALLVDARLAAGKSPLGWLNPLIYQNPTVFNDVTSGNNPGCFTNGFQAAAGWDPITGFGSPNYPALLKLVMSLP